jgi:hypothetical protein
MDKEQVEDLLLEALEHELGGVNLYQQALECVVHPDLAKEFAHYLEETRSHVATVSGLCESLGVDPRKETPGRLVVRQTGEALTAVIKAARAAGNPAKAEIVACECVVLAETKDHLNWMLIGKCAEAMDGPHAKVLKSAYDAVESQEDEHLYHTRGWCRELWIQMLGMNAVLPPPEERRKVKTAIGAAKAEQEADNLR